MPKLGPIPIPGRLIRYGLYGLAGSAAICVAAAIIFWQSLYIGMPALPDTDTLWSKGRTQAYEFRDRDGDLIAVRGPHYGRVIQVADLSPHVVQAFIAAEDKRFYEHDGADTTAILRAAWANWRSGRTISGASTITQQVVKNLVLDSKQTLRRKAQEVRLARQLETRMSKDEILTLYLNRIYFGSGAYGIDAATEEYFGKSPTELTLGEAALLATLPKAPSRLALDSNLEAARSRQLYVLNRMAEAGFISDSHKEAAFAADVTLIEAETSDAEFGYVLDLVTERVGEMLPDAPGDLVITLTIDREIQRTAQEIIASEIETRGPDLDASQAAAVLMETGGAVTALIGGVDYDASQFNRATQARRQPGSAFKPILFAAALQAGIDPFTVYQDTPVKFDDWEPRNYTDGYVGPVTVSEAFAKSLNTVAAQVGRDVGEERIVALARSFGILSDMEPLPSIALGSQEVTLYELTRAFGVFAKSGNRLDPYLILRIEDSRGGLIYERPAYDPVRVYPANLARDMNGMLARVVQGGTGRRAAIPGWTVAGKTGTSQDSRDAWFIGFTSQLIGGVWVGNDDDSPMDKVTGGGLPADIWASIMSAALENTSAAPIPGAENVVVPNEAAEQRITFYRGLAGAFRRSSETTVINAASPRASQR